VYPTHSLPADPNHIRKLVSDALLSKGIASASLAFSTAESTQIWTEQYGTRRRSEAIKRAASLPSSALNFPDYLKPSSFLLKKGFTETDREIGLISTQPITASTHFMAGSISKPVTAVAVMRLVQQGLLDLDTDVNEYLKNAKWQMKVPPSTAKPDCDDKSARVTLRHLLSHAAGLENNNGVRQLIRYLLLPSLGWPRLGRLLHMLQLAPQPWKWTAEERDFILKIIRNENYELAYEIPKVTARRILDSIYSSKPNSNEAPIRGTSFYSNTGYSIIQLIVESVTDKPFSQAVKELVFDPLHLNSSFEVFGNCAPNGGDFAAGHYHLEPVGAIPVPGAFTSIVPAAAGGLWTSAQDVCKIVKTVYNAREGLHPFLAEKYAKEMISPSPFHSSLDGMKFGLGWVIANDSDGGGFWHNGCIMGFWSHTRCFKDGTVFTMLITGDILSETPFKAIEQAILDSHRDEPIL
jgi:CubicO group peptidase (beta-lactamase class C family)